MRTVYPQAQISNLVAAIELLRDEMFLKRQLPRFRKIPDESSHAADSAVVRYRDTFVFDLRDCTANEHDPGDRFMYPLSAEQNFFRIYICSDSAPTSKDYLRERNNGKKK